MPGLVEPLRLAYDDLPDDGFVDGWRLSTDCIARRAIEPLEPDRYHEFPEALGRRGHGFERIVQDMLRDVYDINAIREVVIPWEYGESHLDLLLPQGGGPDVWDTDGRALQIELKANKDGQVRSENVRQVQRQQFAMERAIAAGKPLRAPLKLEDGSWGWQTIDPALYADAVWRVMVVDPTTWNIPDPRGVTVTISDDRRRELEAEWENMHELMQMRPIDIRWASQMSGHRLLKCTCGKCYRPDPEELPKDLAEHASLHLDASEEVAVAEAEKLIHTNYLKERMALLKPDAQTAADRAGSWVGEGFKVTLTKSGALRVTRSDQKVIPLL